MALLAPRDLPQPGSLVGRYRLLGRIGGGMSVVYEAEDTVLNRRVALKTLPQDGSDLATRERLLQEARVAARISHPHVVTVFDVVSCGELDFLVMEFLPLGSVADLLDRRGPLDWRLATQFAAQACAGLAAAHAAGIVHRDIKPSNLLLAADGPASANDDVAGSMPFVKLSDFGISRAGRGTTTIHAGTVVLGTADYMSPEQCEGEAEPRSDLYSLGATYFALLTGRPPYTAAHPLQVMFQHCSSPIPDPGDRVADLPPGCAAIVRRALAKQPHDRFRDAREMQQALEGFLAGTADEAACRANLECPANAVHSSPSTNLPPPNAASSWQSRRRALAFGGLLALVLAIGIVAVVAGRLPWPGRSADRNLPLDVSAAPLTLAVDRQLASPVALAWRPGSRRLHGELQMCVVSPNLRYLACALDDGGGLVWDLEADERTRWLERPDGPPQVSAVAFTADSRFVVSATANLVQIHNIPVGRYERLQQLAGEAIAVAVSPCGQYLAVAEIRGDTPSSVIWLHRLSLHDGQWQLGQSHNFPHPGRDVVGALAFSADSRYLAASDVLGNLGIYEVAKARLLRTLRMPEQEQRGNYGRSAAFSPDSRWLAVAGDRRLVLWDTSQWRQRSLAAAHQSPIAQVAFSRDGHWLISAASDGLLVWDVATGQPLRDRPVGNAGNDVRSLVFLGGDEWLLSCAVDKKLLLWNWRQAFDVGARHKDSPP